MLKNKNSKLRTVKINLETSNFLFLIPHSPGHGKKLYSVQNFRKVYFWAKMKHSSVQPPSDICIVGVRIYRCMLNKLEKSLGLFLN